MNTEAQTHRCNRRTFLNMAVPTCAATCLALSGAPAAAFGTRSPGQAAGRSTSNRFDEALDQPLTYRQMFEAQCEEFIPLTPRR
jgi:nitrous oxide reductase